MTERKSTREVFSQPAAGVHPIAKEYTEEHQAMIIELREVCTGAYLPVVCPTELSVSVYVVTLSLLVRSVSLAPINRLLPTERASVDRGARVLCAIHASGQVENGRREEADKGYHRVEEGVQAGSDLC